MSKRSAKPAGPVTRKQQVEALRATKGQEVAASVAVQVAAQMKELVDKAVEAKFKSVLDTITDLIDRVGDLESVCYEDGERPSQDEEVEASPMNNIRYHCTHCGYIGPEPDHDDCPMMACLLVTPDEVNRLGGVDHKTTPCKPR